MLARARRGDVNHTQTQPEVGQFVGSDEWVVEPYKRARNCDFFSTKGKLNVKNLKIFAKVLNSLVSTAMLVLGRRYKNWVAR